YLGLTGDALRAEYAADQPREGEPWFGMNGAAADGWSRLVLAFDVRPSDTHAELRFKLELDDTGPPFQSHHDVDFPIGSLSLDGFGQAGPTIQLDVPPTVVNGKRSFIAVYTPPAFFPFRPGQNDKRGYADLRIVVSELDGTVLNRTSLRLVRPPVMVLHGLFG